MHEPPYRVKNMMPGMIMLWHGTVENIPSGWHICNGTMGTPDLRNVFVVGASGAFAPGDNNPVSAHSHPFTGDGHNHEIPQTAGCPGAGPNPCLDGTHTSSDPAVGTTGNTVGYPPYYALCYIQKL